MKNRFARTAVMMGIIILASKLMGLVRDIMIAGAYGTTVYAIAYETASKLPINIFDFVLGGVVTSAFVPIYSSIALKEGKERALAFAQSYSNLVLALTGTLSIIGVTFAPALVSLIAPELSAECASLAAMLTRIMFPMVIFVGIAFTFVGFLQSEGEYNIPALISLVSNLIMVGYLAFARSFIDDPRISVTGLSAAMLIGWAAQAAVQIPSVRRRGFRWNLRAPIFTPATKRALRNGLPILAATWTTPVCSLINTRVASGIEGGRAIGALGYANRLYIIIVGLFSFVATNLLFPYFARADAAGDTGEKDRMTRRSVKVLTFLIAPISVGVAVLAEPFVSLIYEGGSFTSSDTVITADALRFYAVGMVFAAVCEVLTKAFFAAEKNKYPMIAALVSMTFNVGVILTLGDRLSVGGVALVTGLSSGVNMAVNLFFAYRTGMISRSRADLWDIAKTILSALVMGAAVDFVHSRAAALPQLLAFALSVLVGVAVYAVCVTLLRTEEMRGILKKLK
ncbi:MAG: murein biosynthesis integral membrane protein MurJ [Eubacteriales bacterium]